VLSDGGLLKLRRKLPLLLVRPLAARPLFGLAGWLCDAESIPKGTRRMYCSVLDQDAFIVFITVDEESTRSFIK
jgi:hypothetical protein